MVDQLIRIRMDSLEVTKQVMPEQYTYLAGRALSSQLILDEVAAHAEPLGPNNKLVITCGLLAGTTVSSANRLSIGAKSPLTGGIKESNAGGIAAYKMGRLGIRALVVENVPSGADWYVLVIRQNSCELKVANHLAGKGIVDKAALLYQEYGAKAGIIIIGPAGEKRLLTAGIANNDPNGAPCRFSGRGGLGAVMGSKRLLAIVLDDSGCPLPAMVQPDDFAAKMREFHQAILANPQTAEVFPKYGTAAMTEITNAIGGLPTRNFADGRFSGADQINGEALYQTIVSRGGEGKPSHACMPGCMIRCSNVYPDKEGKTLVSPLEYETICLLGSNLEVGDLDAIAEANRLCNDYGVDTIEIGCAIGVAMEAGVAPFGDPQALVNLLHEVVQDTWLGRILAAGCLVAGKTLGVIRVPAVKGQGMAAYEPRAIKGTAFTYATSPMGADHTAGNVARANVKHHEKDGQVTLSRNAQQGMAMIDALGMCMMVGPALKDRTLLAELINARFGWQLTLQDLTAMASQTLAAEKEFNRRAGFTDVHDRLPEHFYYEVNPSTGSVYDIFPEDMKD